jgi:hypothetical protein
MKIRSYQVPQLRQRRHEGSLLSRKLGAKKDLLVTFLNQRENPGLQNPEVRFITAGS